MYPTVHDVGRAYSNAPDSWGVRIGNKKKTKMADTITKSAWQSIFYLLQKYGDLQEKYYRNVLYWNMHPLSGTLTSKLTSKPWSKSNDVPLDMSSMTTQQEPQDVSQRC